jgi:hypothetical protein
MYLDILPQDIPTVWRVEELWITGLMDYWDYGNQAVAEEFASFLRVENRQFGITKNTVTCRPLTDDEVVKHALKFYSMRVGKSND